MNRWKRISLLIVFTLIFGIIAFFHESRLGKWIDNEVYEFIYSSESFITTSIMLGVTKIGEVWAMVCLLYTSPSPRDKRQSRMPSSA